MMKTDLAMALHFHQPVGNFDHIFERACDKCYIPFLETLKKYPEIKMTFHFTGCLLEWAEKHRPQMLDMVKEMVNSSRVEVMSGGFYEPILPSIPEEDRKGQIAMLTDYVRKNFSYEPKGAWIAERVWEPELPSVLYDAGIKYVILDETHFLYSGITKERTYGYYVTEDNSKHVAVFPSDKILRYSIPFRMPEESMEYMKGVLRGNKDAFFIYGDDGEKFGEWPGTHKWVYDDGWLVKFFDALMQNSDWLQTSTLSECLEKRSPLGKVYLPTASYDEMMEWALPADMQRYFERVLEDVKFSGKMEFYRPFIRGGFWRNFLAKYPEADNMNKKMVYVSGKLKEAGKNKAKNEKTLQEAEKNLFRGQCNCAYWHGVFGGLYLFHLRSAIYGNLINSERLIDEALHGKEPYCEAKTADIDADGLEEVMLENRDLSLYIDPSDGGTLKEIDVKGACCNLVNTLARRKEAYHEKIIDRIKEGGNSNSGDVKTIHDRIQEVSADLEEHLVYDSYNKYCFVDHFLRKGTDPEAFRKCRYEEAGDFVKGVYDLDVSKSNEGISVILKKDGLVDGNTVRIEKEINFPEEGKFFEVRYKLKNTDCKTLEAIFAPEINITMPYADSERYKFIPGGGKKGFSLKGEANQEGIDSLKIDDSEKGLSVELSFSQKCSIWHIPIKTVSQSEKAYELNYQGSSFLPALETGLEGGEELTFEIKVKII